MDLLLLVITATVTFEITWACGTDLAYRRDPDFPGQYRPGAHARMIRG